MCFCFARAAGSPKCSSSGTWGSRMRIWCWGRCRPQMVTSSRPWSSYLLEAQDSEPVPHRQRRESSASGCPDMRNDGFRHTVFFIMTLFSYIQCHIWVPQSSRQLSLIDVTGHIINVIMLTSSTPVFLFNRWHWLQTYRIGPVGLTLLKFRCTIIRSPCSESLFSLCLLTYNQNKYQVAVLQCL